MPTLVELKKIATRLKIKGRSSMNKHELEQVIRNHNLTHGSRKPRAKPRAKKSRKPRAKKSRKPRAKKSRKPRAKKSRKKTRKY
jgi:hypothetical protein